MSTGNAGYGLGHQAWAVQKRAKAVKEAELKQAVGLGPGSRLGSNVLNLWLFPYHQLKRRPLEDCNYKQRKH